MFSARGVALNVITASVQLRVLHSSVYLSARLKLRGTNYTLFCVATVSMVEFTRSVLQRRTVKCVADSDLERMWKEKIVVFPRNLPGNTEETHENNLIMSYPGSRLSSCFCWTEKNSKSRGLIHLHFELRFKEGKCRMGQGGKVKFKLLKLKEEKERKRERE
jgi:hypothetical protein